MKPDEPNGETWLEPELEARLVASLLKETSAFEEAELDRLMKERPEIRVLHGRLKAVHGLLGEATSQGPDDDWRLPRDQRIKLLHTPRNEAPAEPAVKPSGKGKRSHSIWLNVAATAAVLTVASTLWTLDSGRPGSSAMLGSSRESRAEGKGSTGAILEEKDGHWHAMPSSRAGGEDSVRAGVEADLLSRQAQLAQASGVKVVRELRDGNAFPVAELGAMPSRRTATPSDAELGNSLSVHYEAGGDPFAPRAAEESTELADPFADYFSSDGDTLGKSMLADSTSPGLGEGVGEAFGEKLAGEPLPNVIFPTSPATPAEKLSEALDDDVLDEYVAEEAMSPRPPSRGFAGTLAEDDFEGPDQDLDGLAPAYQWSWAEGESSKSLPDTEREAVRSFGVDARGRQQAGEVEAATGGLSVTGRGGVAHREAEVAGGQMAAELESEAGALRSISEEESEGESNARFGTGADGRSAAAGDHLGQGLGHRGEWQGDGAQTTEGFALAEKSDEAWKEGAAPLAKEPVDAAADTQAGGGVAAWVRSAERSVDLHAPSIRLDGNGRGTSLRDAMAKDPSEVEEVQRYANANGKRFALEAEPGSEDQREAYRLRFEKESEIRGRRLYGENHAGRKPFSTFSLHVADVAFKLARAALLDKNTWPDAATVRVEEFVNAFDYGDPAPSLAEKVACHMEQAAHPFRQQRNVLRIAMRTAEVGRTPVTPLQLTILLDTSGSMKRADRQESVQRAMEMLTSQLRANDTVTLIGFARRPRLIQDRLTGEALAGLPQWVKRTPSEGGTNFEEALLLGGDHARRQFVVGAQNRIVLITDGAANLGDADPESLREMVVDLRQEGIAFDACGVGAERLNDTILEALTRQGDGRYYFLDEPGDADEGFALQLAGAFRPAARNVKVQVRFNPRRVGHYRLVGFEKHRLKKEDFRDDTVDAAEMASSEAGVALYEIEPLPQGDGEIGEVGVRFQDPATGRMIERAWTIRYRPGLPSLDGASHALQLAGTAAFLGEKLKGSALGEIVDLDELAQMTTNLRQHYGTNQRVKDLIAMIAKVKELQP